MGSSAQVLPSLNALPDAQMDIVFRKEEGLARSAGESVLTAYEQFRRAKVAYDELRQDQRMILNGAIALEQERLQKAQVKLDALKLKVQESQKRRFLARFDGRRQAVIEQVTAYLNNAQKDVDAHENRLAKLINARQQANELDARVENLH